MILSSISSRFRSTSLRSAPLVTMTVAALLLWGCGSSGGGGGTGGEATGGAGGSHTGGTNGSGGAKGGSTGTGGQSETGGAGGQSATGGAGGQSETGGAGGQSATGGAGGQSATGGVGGQSAIGGAGGHPATGGAGGQSATGGVGGQSATGGVGGQSATGGAAGAGTGGTAGQTGTGGAGGTTPACPTGMACTATGNVKGICASNVCTTCTNGAAGDTACAGAYGNGNICVANACVAGDCHNTNSECTGGKVCLNDNCSDCASDAQCGANHLCVGTSCVAGNCRATADCGTTSGLVCVNMTCTGCSVDNDCAPYGQYICVSNICTPGNCHSTGDCVTNGNAGKVCDLGSHTCTTCSSDTQCSDPANYNSGHFCQNSACVSGQCRTASQCSGGQVCNSNLICGACAGNADCTNTTFGYGPAHVCSGGSCIAGTCTATSDCASAGQLCKGNACVACATDGDCMGDTFYGSAHICVNNQCVAGTCHDSSTCTGTNQVCNPGTHACAACGSDTVCQNDASYGTAYICLSNATCVQGNCHDTSTECQNGQICGVSTAHACGACATDTQCRNDSHYGSGDICYLSACSPGDCHGTSGDCNSANGDAGEICGATATNTCGKCSTDTQCQSDGAYGSAFICETAAGATQGTCVSDLCSSSGACAANGSDFCCGGTCVPGNCCVDTDCGAFGTACVGHTCSACNAVSGNKFYVDPVNGNDSTATGSNMTGTTVAPGCAFQTIAAAIRAMPVTPFAGTQIIIVGKSSGPTDLAASDLQTAAAAIILPANTTLTTTGGAITITLKTQANKANFSGFQLQNSGSGIAGDPSAPLTLNGSGHAAGVGIVVNPSGPNASAATFNISNVAVENTGGVGIRVNAGTLTIGGGVVVSGSSSDGLLVAAGTANITNTSGTQTLFTGNSIGIEAQTTGAVNITGTPTSVPSNNGTVLSSFNVNDGLRIDQTPGSAVTCSINGLVAWGNGAPNIAPGVRLFGGSTVKIRNSVLLSNGTFGVQISSTNNTTSAGADVSGMDLGTSGDLGKNYLQAPFGGAGVNGSGGLCVALTNYAPAPLQPLTLTETVNAYGNELASSAAPSTQVNCATTAAAVTQGTCSALHSIGINTATSITTNVTFGMCM